MKHLLIDFDSKIPNLALMKISAWAKAKGDQVYLNDDSVEPDVIWLSCIFTWNASKAKSALALYRFRFPNAVIHYGGTGFDFFLPYGSPEWKNCHNNGLCHRYRLLDKIPEASQCQGCSTNGGNRMKAIKKSVVIEFEFAKEDGEVEALGGRVKYKKGDAIVTGVKGEKYPCRRDIFDQTYSIVEEGQPDITITFTKEECSPS